jgi:murein DD-endopeptidase MepM/ murein hydrolase activator NlpD
VKLKPTHPGGQAENSGGGNPPVLLPWLLWGIALLMVALAIFVLVRRPAFAAATPASVVQAGGTVAKTQDIPSIPANSGMVAGLPAFAPGSTDSVSRAANAHTTIPDRPSTSPSAYTVTIGDSVFSVADQFKLKPETVLWANYSVLKDNPDMLSVGQDLTIPPTDGVLYKWKDGDTLDAIAGQFKANAKDILLWPGNNLDLLKPIVAPGSLIMIPGGRREFQQTWVVPTIPRGPAGVMATIAGTCNSSGGAYGTGQFMWPVSSHYISGNDYWSGHLAIDIGATLGLPVVAADSGVVVFSGWNNNGYGNMIMIDHGNGFQTLYGHLSVRSVVCGQSVYKGVVIGAAGSTGNSTGPHLHFEIRLMGGFVNPHGYLPPP